MSILLTALFGLGWSHQLELYKPEHNWVRLSSYHVNKPSTNKFRPHQGKRECARRVRQREKANGAG